MRAPLLVAGPNLTLDRTSRLAVLRPGEVQRAREVAVTAGGKGVNVCRAAASLGRAATLVSFLPARTGEAAAALLADERIDLVAVPIEGELRSTAIVIEDGGRTTVLNEPGPPVSGADWPAYERAIAERLEGAGALVCSGSLPPGAPDGGYARLAALARAATWACVVDAGGAVLREAVASGAVVAPNLGEAESVLAGEQLGESVAAASDARERALAAARGLVEQGAAAAVVTAAGAGAAFADSAGGEGSVAAPPVIVRNPIGAGDAFTAALAGGLADGAPLGRAVQLGVAAGSASVEFPLAGRLDAGRALSLSTEPEAG